VADANGDDVASFLGDGSGGFGPPEVVSLPTNFGAALLVVADFNHDGKRDLAVLGSGTNARDIIVLLGNGDGTFVKKNVLIPGVTILSAGAVGDFNGDGQPDVAVSG